MANIERHRPPEPSSSSGGSAKWLNTRFTGFSSRDRTNSAQLPETSSTQQGTSDTPRDRSGGIGTGNAGRWHLRWRPLPDEGRSGTGLLAALRRVTGNLRHNSAPLESGRNDSARSDGRGEPSSGRFGETLRRFTDSLRRNSAPLRAETEVGNNDNQALLPTLGAGMEISGNSVAPAALSEVSHAGELSYQPHDRQTFPKQQEHNSGSQSIDAQQAALLASTQEALASVQRIEASKIAATASTSDAQKDKRVSEAEAESDSDDGGIYDLDPFANLYQSSSRPTETQPSFLETHGPPVIRSAKLEKRTIPQQDSPSTVQEVSPSEQNSREYREARRGLRSAIEAIDNNPIAPISKTYQYKSDEWHDYPLVVLNQSKWSPEEITEIEQFKVFQNFKQCEQEFQRVLREAQSYRDQYEGTRKQVLQASNDLPTRYANLFISLEALKDHLDARQEIKEALQNNGKASLLDNIDKYRYWHQKDIAWYQQDAVRSREIQKMEQGYQGLKKALEQVQLDKQRGKEPDKLQLSQLVDQHLKLAHSFEEVVANILEARSQSEVTFDDLKERYDLHLRPQEGKENKFDERSEVYWQGVLDESVSGTYEDGKKIDLNRLKTKLDEKSVELAENTEISIGRTPESLYRILKYRRFRTILEKKQPLREEDYRRIETEQALWDYPDLNTSDGKPGFDGKLGIIYGALIDKSRPEARDEDLERYGSVDIRPINIEECTTLTMGDSYHCYSPSERQINAKAVPLTKPNRDAFILNSPFPLPNYNPLLLQSVHDLKKFAETQTHGGMSSRSIGRVIFRDPDHPLVPKLKEMLQKQNITWEDLPPTPVAW